MFLQARLHLSERPFNIRVLSFKGSDLANNIWTCSRSSLTLPRAPGYALPAKYKYKYYPPHTPRVVTVYFHSSDRVEWELELPRSPQPGIEAPMQRCKEVGADRFNQEQKNFALVILRLTRPLG